MPHGTLVVGGVIDPEGMVSLFPITMGENISRQFGFIRGTDKTQMYVPTAEAMNRSIQETNIILEKKGLKRIPVSFYEVNSGQPYVAKQALDRFIDQGQIPLERTGSAAIHDLSFHSSSIAIPEKIWTRARDNFRAGRDFLNYLESKGVSEKNRNKVLETLLKRMDLFGNLPNVLIHKSPNFFSDQVLKGIRYQTGHDMSQR